MVSHSDHGSAPGPEAGGAPFGQNGASGRGGRGGQSGQGSFKARQGSAADRAEADLLRRVPPHSVEAEQAVLGGVLMRPQLMHAIVDQLAAEDFYVPTHSTIYAAFLELYRKSAPIDLLSTAEMLKSRNALEEAGGAVYLGDLAQAVVSGANAEYYATIVRDKALQRGPG